MVSLIFAVTPAFFSHMGLQAGLESVIWANDDVGNVWGPCHRSAALPHRRDHAGMPQPLFFQVR